MNNDNVSPLRPGAVFNATRPLPGLEPHPAGITLSQYGPRWIAERLAPSGQPLRPRTKELYEGQLRLHLLPAFGTLDLAEITTPDIRRWCEQMRSPRGPGAVTAAKCYRLLHSIMDTAA